MKSNRAHVLAFCAFAAAVAITSGNAVQFDYFKGVQKSNDRCNTLTQYLYKTLYCDGRQCPKWACQDDTAVIHGYCCGCPSPLKVNVPVLCVEDLVCPYRKNDLCDAYNFMITCCCSDPPI